MQAEFKSTYNIYVLTQNPLQKDADFEFTYYVVDVTIEQPPAPQFSLYITICVGIPMLVITMCVFEGKNLLIWFRSKLNFFSRGSGHIGTEPGSDQTGELNRQSLDALGNQSQDYDNPG